MTLKKHYLAGLLATITALAVLPLLNMALSAHAASGTSLSLSPASQSVTVGGNQVVTIVLNSGGDSVNTVQSVFSYSAAHYSLVSITPGASFGSFPDTISSGSIEFSAAPTGSVTGSAVTVATVTLHSTASGTSAMGLASVCPSGNFGLTCSAAYDSTTFNNDLSSVAGGSYTVNPVTVPLPSTPTGVTATANSATSVSVKWTGSTDTGGPGLGGYDILRGGTKVGSVNATTTSYTDNTAAPNTTYNYTVEAFDTGSTPNVSAQSSAASVTTPNYPLPSTPSGVTASANSATSVSVKWTGSTDTGGPGLSGYDVYRNGTLLAGTTAPTYTDNTAAPNTTYSYTVDAFDIASPPNVSAQSSAASVTTPKTPPPSTPTGVTASANTAKSVTLSWTGSTDTGGPGLSGYNIFRGGTKVGSVNATITTYTDSTVAANTTYSYTIEAFDKASPPNVSAPSNAASVTTPKTPLPSVPANVSASANSSTSISVKWSASTDSGGPGLGGYNIFRGGTKVGSVNATTTSYTNTTLTANTTYSYTIEAFDTASPPNVSAQSSAASATTSKIPAPSTPTGVTASANSPTSATVKWSGSTDSGGPGLGGYNILRGGTKVGSVNATTTSYTDITAAPNTTYSYTIEAFDVASPQDVSAPSSAASVTTPKTPLPSTPTGVTVSANSSTSATVKWTGSTDKSGPGLGGYNILRGGTKVGSVNATTTSYTNTTLTANTTYSYTIEAFDTASPPNVSAPSSAASVTTPKTPTPTTPTGVTAKADSTTSVTVSWTASTDANGPGVAGYYIIRNGTTITQVSASTSSPVTYTDTTVAPNTTYSYTIEAFDTASPPNVSAPSSAASVTTPVATNALPPTTPNGLQATAISSSQINLNWTSSTANVPVEGYYVYRSTHAHRHNSYSLVATVPANSYGNTNLSAKTTYYYYVVAFDSAGRSGKSSIVNAVTKSNTSTATTVLGRVTSTSTQSPISGVYVRTGIRGTADGAATSYTNSAGEYVLDNVKASHFETYHYSHDDYTTLRLYKHFPSGIHTLNASLTPKNHRHHRR